MTTDAAKAFEFETAFLSAVRGSFDAARGKQFRGQTWKWSLNDECDRLRALLASNQDFDREKLKSLPANRRIALHGFERRALLWKRPTGVAIASVLSPMSHFATSPDTDGPAVGLGELMDHVRKLVGEGGVAHVVGVCSPTGFTDDARGARFDMPGVSVVLIAPDGRGGWKITPASEKIEPHLLEIFDPEGANDKLDRVREAVEKRSADLLTGSLSASSIERETSLPKELVRQAFKQIAGADPELRLTEKDGECMLFRGAPLHHQERKSMNVIDRIKQLFSGEGDEVEKINLLAERRAALAQRRDRIYEDISKLETKDADLLSQGKTATSPVPKRRLAAQLAQLRKDIARQNTTAAMLNKQIDIISTDIHNLTLIQQGEVAQLPDTAELTENAVKAEEMLETLQADAELVGSLETGMEETLTGDEELAILREFDGTKESEPTTAAAQPVQEEQERSGSDKSATLPAAEPVREEPPSKAPGETDRPADAEAT